MLADVAREKLPHKTIFNLGRNELLFLRLAQIELLLEHGLKPERIFVELMPVDVLPLGRQPLANVQVTSQGALTYRMRLPSEPLAGLIRLSRLAAVAWVRSGKHCGNPAFDPRKIAIGVPPRLHADLLRIFSRLARVTNERHVPVTVVLIPTYHQVIRNEAFGFQDQLGVTFRQLGFDVFDPRQAFCRHAAPASLFLPDKHLTRIGNELLLDELLEHLKTVDSRQLALREARAP